MTDLNNQLKEKEAKGRETLIEMLWKAKSIKPEELVRFKVVDGLAVIYFDTSKGDIVISSIYLGDLGLTPAQCQIIYNEWNICDTFMPRFNEWVYKQDDLAQAKEKKEHDEIFIRKLFEDTYELLKTPDFGRHYPADRKSVTTCRPDGKCENLLTYQLKQDASNIKWLDEIYDSWCQEKKASLKLTTQLSNEELKKIDLEEIFKGFELTKEKMGTNEFLRNYSVVEKKVALAYSTQNKLDNNDWYYTVKSDLSLAEFNKLRSEWCNADFVKEQQKAERAKILAKKAFKEFRQSVLDKHCIADFRISSTDPVINGNQSLLELKAYLQTGEGEVFIPDEIAKHLTLIEGDDLVLQMIDEEQAAKKKLNTFDQNNIDDVRDKILAADSTNQKKTEAKQSLIKLLNDWFKETPAEKIDLRYSTASIYPASILPRICVDGVHKLTLPFADAYVLGFTGMEECFQQWHSSKVMVERQAAVNKWREEKMTTIENLKQSLDKIQPTKMSKETFQAFLDSFCKTTLAGERIECELQANNILFKSVLGNGTLRKVIAAIDLSGAEFSAMEAFVMFGAWQNAKVGAMAQEKLTVSSFIEELNELSKAKPNEINVQLNVVVKDATVFIERMNDFVTGGAPLLFSKQFPKETISFAPDFAIALFKEWKENKSYWAPQVETPKRSISDFISALNEVADRANLTGSNKPRISIEITDKDVSISLIHPDAPDYIIYGQTLPWAGNNFSPEDAKKTFDNWQHPKKLHVNDPAKVKEFFEKEIQNLIVFCKGDVKENQINDFTVSFDDKKSVVHFNKNGNELSKIMKISADTYDVDLTQVKLEEIQQYLDETIQQVYWNYNADVRIQERKLNNTSLLAVERLIQEEDLSQAKLNLLMLQKNYIVNFIHEHWADRTKECVIVGYSPDDQFCDGDTKVFQKYLSISDAKEAIPLPAYLTNLFSINELREFCNTSDSKNHCVGGKQAQPLNPAIKLVDDVPTAFESFITRTKNDAIQASYGTAANLITELLRSVALTILKDHTSDSKVLSAAESFLETEFGTSLLHTLLGSGLTYIPGVPDNEHVKILATKFRQKGIEKIMTTLGKETLNHLFPLAKDISSLLPKEDGSIDSASIGTLLAKVSKKPKQNKRVKVRVKAQPKSVEVKPKESVIEKVEPTEEERDLLEEELIQSGKIDYRLN